MPILLILIDNLPGDSSSFRSLGLGRAIVLYVIPFEEDYVCQLSIDIFFKDLLLVAQIPIYLSILSTSSSRVRLLELVSILTTAIPRTMATRGLNSKNSNLYDLSSYRVWLLELVCSITLIDKVVLNYDSKRP